MYFTEDKHSVLHFKSVVYEYSTETDVWEQRHKGPWTAAELSCRPTGSGYLCC